MMHVYSLRRGKHSNVYMQRAFDKYGEGSFSVSILEESRELMSELEQWWLDEMVGHPRVMNIATSSNGGPMAMETRMQISKSLMGKKSNGKRPATGAVEGTHKDGSIVRFNSAADAARAGFSESGISRCIRDNNRRHKGYKWIRIRP